MDGRKYSKKYRKCFSLLRLKVKKITFEHILMEFQSNKASRLKNEILTRSPTSHVQQWMQVDNGAEFSKGIALT